MQIIILVLKSLHRRIGMQLFGQHIIIINLLVIKVLLPVYVVDVIIVWLAFILCWGPRLLYVSAIPIKRRNKAVWLT